MAIRDLISNVKAIQGFAPVTVTDNTATQSGIIDLQGYNSVAFFLQTGTLADIDATFAITLIAGDNSGLSDGAAPAATEILGTTAFTFADDNKVIKTGYVGSKRYIRYTVTPSNNTGNAPYALQVHLGHSGLSAPLS